MESSVAELIENLNRLEVLTKDQMNELASVRQENLSVKWNLTRYGEKSKEIVSALNSSRELLSSKQFDLKLLEHREKTLRDELLPEKKNALEAEKSSLEQLHGHIWQARRDFCEKAKEFNKRDGFLTSNFHSHEEEKEMHGQVHPEFLPKVTDEDLDLLVGDIASLEKELLKTNSEVFTLNEKLAAAKSEIDMLTNEPTSGTDFIRLQEARAYSQNQVDLIESRCKKVQDEIFSSEKIIQSLTMEQRAPEAEYHDYANAARNKYFNQASKNVTQTHSAKNFERAKGLNNTTGLETTREETQDPQAQFRRKTPSKVTFASSDQYVNDKENVHTEKLLMRAETRMKEMQTARDAFLKMKGDASKSVKTGVTADWLQTCPALPKASATENLALRSSEILKKRAFVPKQPSAVACKLRATNKMLPSNEKKDSKGLNILHNKLSVSAQKSAQTIPKRPTRDEAMEFETTVESGTLSAENLDPPKLPPSSTRSSIFKPPSRMPYIS